jgi:hypothetical protein
MERQNLTDAPPRSVLRPPAAPSLPVGTVKPDPCATHAARFDGPLERDAAESIREAGLRKWDRDVVDGQEHNNDHFALGGPRPDETNSGSTDATDGGERLGRGERAVVPGF